MRTNFIYSPSVTCHRHHHETVSLLKFLSKQEVALQKKVFRIPNPIWRWMLDNSYPTSEFGNLITEGLIFEGVKIKDLAPQIPYPLQRA